VASRKDEKEQLRAEREARERAAQAGEQRRRMVLYGLGALLLVALVVVVVLLITSGGGSSPGGEPAPGDEPTPTATASDETIPAPDPELVADLDAAAKAAGCELLAPKNEGSRHVDTAVEYKANPPTSGDHFPVAAEDGSYIEAPPTERLVHALEHGRIYIQYSADAADEVRDQLQALFDEDPYHMVLAPNTTGMSYEVAATTWDNALVCDSMGDGTFDAIRAFREQYRDQGPEFVP
jgi:hypothetical protein